MKSIMMFIIGIALGLILGLKFGYDFVINTITNESTTIISTLVDEGFGTGADSLLNTYQGQVQEAIDLQQEKLKEEARNQIKDYLTNRINDMF